MTLFTIVIYFCIDYIKGLRMDYDPRIKLNIFQGQTTFQNDYRRFTPDSREKYVWPKARSEPPPKKSAEFIRKDPETFVEWNKDVYIPFNLLMKPRPIIDTTPYATIPRLKDQAKDAEKSDVMKSRPRLYMTPAVSMDDVPDPEMRKLICDYMYTTDFRRAEKEAAMGENTREIATSTLDVGLDPVKLRTELYPPLPLGWREKGRAWDSRQMRALVDPTETFWFKRGSRVKCGACNNPYKGAVPQSVKDEIATLIRKDKLRLAHDYPIPGYTGLRPMLSAGVPLSKTDLPVTHPFLSASQAVTQRYAEDKNV
ncbi:hypothetical protein PPYR_08497 [Photinus pyralis]|uniref:Uncharacterized protein n=2 Tax=Photinus pyralis TaxID=7054 RepID=A0A5N4AJM9_PHOPY|nr:uncharacterized protein LOC116171471 [Photinus pyralis]XP_031345097.1 uncharacterized protein LOC116172100 [Photinus pyralis]KAB0797504.1 hypothetical protein PPYR_08497 [Photinus pyralis]